MPESSRKGRRIASKACDLCRERKVQCVFEAENAESCQKCLKSGVPCTFFTDRKPRGPPSRRVAEAKKRAQLASASADGSSFASGSSSTGLAGVGGVGPQVAAAGTSGSSFTAPPPPQTPQQPLPQLQFPPQLPPLAPQSLHAVPLPIGRVTIEYLLPEKIFFAVIGDYVDRVYPVLPLVHIPTFQSQFQSRRYDTDPDFFRLCMALCAATMASIPRQVDAYCPHLYKDAGELVDRASHLILASRLSSDPAWKNSPSRESMIVSLLLSMAMHYAGHINAGWTYASEAIQYFRSLELWGKAAYAGLPPIEAEMSKRAFWIMYIIQVHDRLSFSIPHTGVSYDPVRTDWDFLLPAEVRDEFLLSNPMLLPPPIPTPGGFRPVISGFIALIRVFLCVGDIVSQAYPGPPASYTLSAGPLNQRFLPVHLTTQSPPSRHFMTPSLETLFKVIKRLHATLNDLPEELRLPAPRRASSVTAAGGPSTLLSPGESATPGGGGDEQQSQSAPPPPPPPPVPLTPVATSSAAAIGAPPLSPEAKLARQFEIMRVNIHVTSLYLQSCMLELCLNALQQPQASGAGTALTSSAAGGGGPRSSSSSTGSVSASALTPDVTSGGATGRDAAETAARIQLWEFRESLARELLNVVTSSSQETLESNGRSMITKIREIAASLLDKDTDRDVGPDIEERNKQYIARFVVILAKLDYAAKNLR